MRTRVVGLLLAAGAVVAAVAIVIPYFRSPAARGVFAVLPTQDNPFWQELIAGLRAEATNLGVEARLDIRVGAADADARTQGQVLSDGLATKNPGVLILGPASSTAVIPMVAAYNRARIPVIVVDSRLDSEELRRNSAHVDVFITSRNEQGGELAARRVAALIGPGTHRVLIVGGSPEHETARARAAGFRRGAADEWKVDEVPANWARDEANRVTRAAIQAGLPRAIFAASDEMAMGVLDGLEGSGVQGADWPVVVGFDATPDGLAAIQDGRLCASIAQKPREIGRRAMVAAVAFLRGEPTGASEVQLDLSVVPPALEACRGARTANTDEGKGRSSTAADRGGR